MKIPRPLVLTVLDGWGISDKKEGNAIYGAQPQNYLSFLEKYPNTTLKVAGEAVGLPEGQMGNSEVGHLNIGAGRVVYQEYTRINKAISDGRFFENPALLRAIENVKKNGTNLHIIGLLSDGGVHSHNTHIYALLELCRRQGVSPFLHMFLDGRDVPPKSAINYIEQLEKVMEEKATGKIATVSGRYYAMDRDKRWERVSLAYRALVYAEGVEAQTAVDSVKQSYKQGVVDEFVKPTVIESRVESREPISSLSRCEELPKATTWQSQIYKGIKNDDSVIFFNFRPDRAREITRAFIQKDFEEFDRSPNPPHVYFVTMTSYDVTFDVDVAFPQNKLDNILTDVLAANHKKQLRIAETEKYAHVTFFLNGGEEEPRLMEDRCLIPSPKIATYDLQPEMSAYEVTDTLISKIPDYDVIISNFANPDMVGHTGDYEATVEAIKVVDKCLGKISGAVLAGGGEMIITADHGNAETMVQPTGSGPHTAHTTDKTPFVYITPKKNIRLRDGGILADVSPTMLEILDIPKPKQMTGTSLIVSGK